MSKWKSSKTLLPASNFRRSLALSGETIENRYAGQNYQASNGGIGEIVPEGEVQQDGGSQNKQERNHGISPDPVGPDGLGVAPAKHEHGSAGDHVKKPLGENRQ